MCKEVKKPELLEEANREYDLFNFDDYAKNLYNNLSLNNSPTVTVLVGEHGTGKTVLLNKVKQLAKDGLWINFECWQYPDKRDLWEALILSLLPDKKYKMFSNKNQFLDNKTTVEKMVDFLKSSLVGHNSIENLLLIIIVYSYTRIKHGIFLSLTIFVILIIINLSSTVIKLKSKSSVSRLEEYKKDLKKTLLKCKKPLYIVLEDMDRAGDLGGQFFETVSHFLKHSDFSDVDIKVIVPIANYDKKKDQSLVSRIEKASDNIFYFNPTLNYDYFISELFSEDFLDEHTKVLLEKTLDPLTKNNIVTIRQVKHLLRNAIIKHNRLLNSGYGSYLAICIAIEFSQYRPKIGGTLSSTMQIKSGSYSHYTPLNDWISKTIQVPVEQNVIISQTIFIISEGIKEVEHIGDIKSHHNSKTFTRKYGVPEVFFKDF